MPFFHQKAILFFDAYSKTAKLNSDIIDVDVRIPLVDEFASQEKRNWKINRQFEIGTYSKTRVLVILKW